jgi:ankyrin repeat protein
MGANCSANQSPLDIAVRGSSPESVHVLIANGASLEDQLSGALFHLWADKGNPAVADELSKAGLDLNAKDGNGKTALHFAVLSRQKQAVQWLLDHKAQINARDRDGLTPLHYAGTGEGKEIVQLLLDHNADVNAEDNKGETPLAHLENYAQKVRGHYLPFEYFDVVKLLVAHGAIKPATSTQVN